MYLKSLELSGFKSFAKKAAITFTTPITGVVGPNGSGKSNTAEAFRFVLGEQSIKSLRGKRGEDMIWNGGGDGTSGAGRANRASVKLTFDNRTKLFPAIDFEEVTLERVVHRDNSNEYLLNGSQVRLKDIVELLASAHIGATGHHIISQGEADRILSASIRERREMIEDALGLKIHQWKKTESLRKLERTAENMKQVESLRREIAPHLKFLKKQVEKVEKAELLRCELIELYTEYFAEEEAYLQSEKLRISQALDGPERELASLDRELERAKKILTDSKNKDEKSHEVIELEEKLKSLRGEQDTVVREIGRLEGEINASTRAVAKEEARVKDEGLRIVYLKDVDALVREVESLSQINEVGKLFAAVMDALHGFVARHHTHTDSSFVTGMGEEIARLAAERTKLEQRRGSLASDEARLIQNYEDLKQKIEREKDTNREAEKDVFRIIARQNEVRAVVGTLRSAAAERDRAEESFKRELGEAAAVAGREAVAYASGGDRQPADRRRQSERRMKIERNKIRLEDAGGSGGAEVVKEFKETEERDRFLVNELKDLEAAKAELVKLIADLDARIDYEFRNGIFKINAEFQRFFSLMFGGGRAELVVVREPQRRRRSEAEDLSVMLATGPADMTAAPDHGEPDGDDGPEGLEVNVSLPRKKVKGLMMLSGGERALTSIALLFAVSQVNPPPFIILDETDAALDEANSKKYGDMIENLSKHSQLILITHNRETMSRAGVLYGVTMGSDGASRLLSIAFEEAVNVAK
ncbi:MAG: AAA family ATPase [Patescibacteria group bacterium]|nr:AAA family ATPase [Patescibacteria group bacterium]MDE2172603.1 AAA family ATPase [Patescibacteria group bacterium]